MKKKKRASSVNIRWLKTVLWYTSVLKPLRVIFASTVLFIIVYEFCIVDAISLYNKTDWWHLLNFISKLSYSYISAFVFYLVAVHTPKERKKVKMFLYVANSTAYLITELRYFHNNFHSYVNVSDTAKASALGDILNKQNPYVPLNAESKLYPDWLSYYEWKSKRVQTLIGNILYLYDFLSPTYLKYLIIIRAQFENVDMQYHHVKGSNNMSIFVLIFPDIKYNIQKLEHEYKKLTPYLNLYHDDIRKENRKRWHEESLE